MTNPYEEARSELASLVTDACRNAIKDGTLPEADLAVPFCEKPGDDANGDLSCTFALVMARIMRLSPRKIADEIVPRISLENSVFKSVSAAGAGFINVRFGTAFFGSVMKSIETAGEKYGSLDIGKGKKVMVEFVSANPTGPMHLGNARGGVLGDTLASLLERAGYSVWREFYVNDAGNQVANFGKSIQARYLQHYLGESSVPFPEDGYHGAYINDIALEFTAVHGDAFVSSSEDERLNAIIVFGLEKNIASMKTDMARYKVVYNCWFPESELHSTGYIADTVRLMDDRGYTYEKDGAKWLRTSDFGAEKDEVLVKANGFYTYYAVDLAYHRNKFEKRCFDICINAFGADHHGHVRRFKAGMEAIGVNPDRLEFMLYQLVELKENGESVRMSKRTGKAITLSTLLDDISVDAARFIFNSKSIDTHLEFDLAEAIKQDTDNPVYYVQYAHARICSLISRLKSEGFKLPAADETDWSLLTAPEELALMHKAALLPEEIRLAVREKEPFRLTKYLVELASLYHSFYTSYRIREAEKPLAFARMKLSDEIRSVMSNVLALIKVSAPERM